MIQITLGGVTFSFIHFNTAPKAVQHKIRLMTEKWGQDIDQAPVFVQHEARLLVEKYGVAQ